MTPLNSVVPAAHCERRVTRPLIRSVAVAVIATMMLNACTTAKQVTGTENCDDPSMTPSQQLLCRDNTTFTQTVAGGAALGGLIGAGGGALACALSGKANPLVCAAIGLGVGLFAGGVSGYVVAKKQEAAKNNQRAIDSVTDDIRQQNESLQADVNAARDVSRQGQRKLARIDAAIRSGQMTADQGKAERDKVANDSQHLATIIGHMEEQQKHFQDAGQQLDQGSGDYDRQLGDMQRNIATLKQQKDALDRAMAASG